MSRWSSAGSGALAGATFSFCIFGFSVITVPGLAIVGGIAGANLDKIKTAGRLIYKLSVSFRCKIMQQDMQKWQKDDDKLKAQITKTIEKETWSTEKIVDFFWSLPSNRLPEQRAVDTGSLSPYTIAKDYVSGLWGTASKTTLPCIIAGAASSIPISLMLSPFLPRLPMYALSAYGALTTITYAIPIAAVLVITFPLMQKVHHRFLLADKDYRTTHYQYKDEQMKNKFHQHWASEAEKLLVRRGLKSGKNSTSSMTE